MDTIPQKHCPKCNNFFPATSDYFCRDKKGKYGLHSHCKQCKSKYNADHREETRITHKQWLENHKAEQKQYNAKYYAEHREEKMLAHDIWKQEHQAEIKQYSIRYHQEHHEELLETYRRYNTEHREERNAKQMQYRQTERGRLMHNTHQNRRRSRQLATSGSYAPQDIQAQYARQKGKCYYCQTKFGKGKRAYHVDHIVPLSRGGSNDPSNLVLACQPCNCRKNDKLLHEWKDGGRLL